MSIGRIVIPFMDPASFIKLFPIVISSLNISNNKVEAISGWTVFTEPLGAATGYAYGGLVFNRTKFNALYIYLQFMFDNIDKIWEFGLRDTFITGNRTGIVRDNTNIFNLAENNVLTPFAMVPVINRVYDMIYTRNKINSTLQIYDTVTNILERKTSLNTFTNPNTTLAIGIQSALATPRILKLRSLYLKASFDD